MKPARVGPSAARIGCAVLVAAVLVLGPTGVSRADQLQWIPLSVCNTAVETIARKPLLVSFCSLADGDHIGLWRVQDLAVAPTSAKDLHEIVVIAEMLYRSDRLWSSEKLLAAREQELLMIPTARTAIMGIDLAYVYVHIGDGSFRCLGKVLGLDCTVDVETILLPSDVMRRIRTRSNGQRPFLPWPLNPAPPLRFP
jgi:hypothetical protein